LPELVLGWGEIPECLPCPEGMHCKLGSYKQQLVNGTACLYPRQEHRAEKFFDVGTDLAVERMNVTAGYWTHKNDPTFVYKCANTDVCPGGEPESCKQCEPGDDECQARRGLVCGVCPLAHTYDELTCGRCIVNDTLVAIIVLVCLVIIPHALYKLLLNHHHWKLSVTESLIISIEMLIEVIQVLGTLLSINIDLHPDLIVMMESLNVFEISFFRVPCLASEVTDPVRYWVAMMLIPVLIIITWIEFAIMKPLPLPPKIKWRFAPTWNMACKIFNTIFVSQVSIGLSPFICFQHPNPLLTKSISEYPSVLCWESSEHTLMMIGGAVSMIMSIGFLVYLVFEMCRAPRKLNGPNGHTYMESILFSVEDFRSDMYWCNIPMKLQELALGVVTVMFPDEARHQVTGFMVIFLVSLALITLGWPFKPPLLNVVLCALYAFIVAALHLATNQLPPASDDQKDRSNAVTFAFALVGFSLMVFVVLLAVTNKCVQKNKLFAIAQLRRHPDFKALGNMWNNCAALSGQQLAAQLEFWEIGQIVNFERILPVLSANVELASWGSAVRYASAKHHADMVKGMDPNFNQQKEEVMGAVQSIGDTRQQSAARASQQGNQAAAPVPEANAGKGWQGGAIVQVSV